MTTEETQAQLLAQWLLQPPGTDPPEGLDENVVSAVYSARPDRAPAPSTTLDDILGAVRTGPYAQRAKFAVVSTPEGRLSAGSIDTGTTSGDESSLPGQTDGETLGDDEDDGPSGELVSLNAARERVAADAANREVQKDVARAERARKARRWWLGPMFGASIAAAAVLVVVAPVAGLYLSPSASRLAETMTLSEPTPAVAAAPNAPAAGDGAPAPDAAPLEAGVAERSDGAQPLPEMADATAALSAESQGARANAGPTTASDAPVGATGGQMDSLGYFSEGDNREKSAKGVELRREYESSTPAVPPAEPPTVLALPAPGRSAPADKAVEERQRVTTGDEAGIAEMQESPAQVEKKSDAWDFGWGKKEKAKDIDDEAEESVAQAQAPPPPKSPAKPAPEPTQAASSTKTATAAKPTTSSAPPASVAASAPATGGAAGSGSTVVTETRSAGVPRDYSSSSVTSRTDVAAAYAAADAAKKAGNIDGAVAAYSALIADSDSRVGQESAIRAASVLRSAGRNSDALAMVEKGLARSPSNTAQRSQLLVVKGDLLSAAGNASGAQAAWAEASRLNAGRYSPVPQAAPAKQ